MTSIVYNKKKCACGRWIGTNVLRQHQKKCAVVKLRREELKLRRDADGLDPDTKLAW